MSEINLHARVNFQFTDTYQSKGKGYFSAEVCLKFKHLLLLIILFESNLINGFMSGEPMFALYSSHNQSFNDLNISNF